MSVDAQQLGAPPCPVPLFRRWRTYRPVDNRRRCRHEWVERAALGLGRIGDRPWVFDRRPLQEPKIISRKREGQARLQADEDLVVRIGRTTVGIVGDGLGSGRDGECSD
jgi:hypothetical protein